MPQQGFQQPQTHQQPDPNTIPPSPPRSDPGGGSVAAASPGNCATKDVKDASTGLATSSTKLQQKTLDWCLTHGAWKMKPSSPVQTANDLVFGASDDPRPQSRVISWGSSRHTLLNTLNLRTTDDQHKDDMGPPSEPITPLTSVFSSTKPAAQAATGSAGPTMADLLQAINGLRGDVAENKAQTSAYLDEVNQLKFELPQIVKNATIEAIADIKAVSSDTDALSDTSDTESIYSAGVSVHSDEHSEGDTDVDSNDAEANSTQQNVFEEDQYGQQNDPLLNAYDARNFTPQSVPGHYYFVHEERLYDVQNGVVDGPIGTDAGLFMIDFDWYLADDHGRFVPMVKVVSPDEMWRLNGMPFSELQSQHGPLLNYRHHPFSAYRRPDSDDSSRSQPHTTDSNKATPHEGSGFAKLQLMITEQSFDGKSSGDWETDNEDQPELADATQSESLIPNVSPHGVTDLESQFYEFGKQYADLEFVEIDENGPEPSMNVAEKSSTSFSNTALHEIHELGTQQADETFNFEAPASLQPGSHTPKTKAFFLDYSDDDFEDLEEEQNGFNNAEPESAATQLASGPQSCDELDQTDSFTGPAETPPRSAEMAPVLDSLTFSQLPPGLTALEEKLNKQIASETADSNMIDETLSTAELTLPEFPDVPKSEPIWARKVADGSEEADDKRTTTEAACLPTAPLTLAQFESLNANVDREGRAEKVEDEAEIFVAAGLPNAHSTRTENESPHQQTQQEEPSNYEGTVDDSTLEASVSDDPILDRSSSVYKQDPADRNNNRIPEHTDAGGAITDNASESLPAGIDQSFAPTETEASKTDDTSDAKDSNADGPGTAPAASDILLEAEPAPATTEPATQEVNDKSDTNEDNTHEAIAMANLDQLSNVATPAPPSTQPDSTDNKGVHDFETTAAVDSNNGNTADQKSITADQAPALIQTSSPTSETALVEDTTNSGGTAKASTPTPLRDAAEQPPTPIWPEITQATKAAPRGDFPTPSTFDFSSATPAKASKSPSPSPPFTPEAAKGARGGQSLSTEQRTTLLQDVDERSTFFGFTANPFTSGSDADKAPFGPSTTEANTNFVPTEESPKSPNKPITPAEATPKFREEPALPTEVAPARSKPKKSERPRAEVIARGKAKQAKDSGIVNGPSMPTGNPRQKKGKVDREAARKQALKEENEKKAAAKKSGKTSLDLLQDERHEKQAEVDMQKKVEAVTIPSLLKR